MKIHKYIAFAHEKLKNKFLGTSIIFSNLDQNYLVSCKLQMVNILLFIVLSNFLYIVIDKKSAFIHNFPDKLKYNTYNTAFFPNLGSRISTQRKYFVLFEWIRCFILDSIPPFFDIWWIRLRCRCWNTGQLIIQFQWNL